MLLLKGGLNWSVFHALHVWTAGNDSQKILNISTIFRAWINGRTPVGQLYLTGTNHWDAPSNPRSYSEMIQIVRVPAISPCKAGRRDVSPSLAVRLCLHFIRVPGCQLLVTGVVLPILKSFYQSKHADEAPKSSQGASARHVPPINVNLLTHVICFW